MSSKKVVTGFNHNVQHRGQGYHVQTEDSGRERAQIVTQLFRGGNVLSSKRTSYRELLNAPNLTELVRALMEEQHKEMLRDLVSGVFDREIAAASGQAPPARLAAETSPQPAPHPPAPLATVPAQPLTRHAPLAKAPAAPSKEPVSDRSLDQVILRYLAGEGDD